jgi:hypothetical protein
MKKNLEDTPVARITPQTGESESIFKRRRENKFDEECWYEAKQIADKFVRQWSGQSERVRSPGSEYLYIRVSSELMDDVREHFKHWHMNSRFRCFIDEVQRVLDFSRASYQPRQGVLPKESSFIPQKCHTSQISLPLYSLQDVFESSSLFSYTTSPVTPPKPLTVHDLPSITPLTHLIQQFRLLDTKFHGLYADSLEESKRMLDQEATTSSHKYERYLLGFLEDSKHQFNDLFQCFKSCLAPSCLREEVMSAAGNWPRITTRTLLRLLARTDRNTNVIEPSAWLRLLIVLGQRLIRLQQAQRCIGYLARRSIEELRKELENDSAEDDEVLRDPDWLLIQVFRFLLLYFE